MTAATGNLIGQGIGIVGKGLAGLFPTTTTTNTNSDTNSDSESNGNFNNFSNQNLITWLSQLMSSYNEQNKTGTSTSSPNLTPQTQALIDKLTAAYSGLSKPVDLSGYEASQGQAINNNSDLARQSAANIMASRGLATSPVSGTTDVNIDNNRFAQLNQLHQNIPLIQNDMNLKNLGAAAGFMNLIPHATTTTDNSNTSGTAGSSTNTQGDQTGSATSGGTTYQGNKAATHTDSTQKQKSGGGLGGMLAGMFG